MHFSQQLTEWSPRLLCQKNTEPKVQTIPGVGQAMTLYTHMTQALAVILTSGTISLSEDRQPWISLIPVGFSNLLQIANVVLCLVILRSTFRLCHKTIIKLSYWPTEYSILFSGRANLCFPISIRKCCDHTARFPLFPSLNSHAFSVLFLFIVTGILFKGGKYNSNFCSINYYCLGWSLVSVVWSQWSFLSTDRALDQVLQ